MGVYCIQWLSSNTVFIYFVARIDPALVIAARSFQPGKQAGEGECPAPDHAVTLGPALALEHHLLELPVQASPLYCATV